MYAFHMRSWLAFFNISRFVFVDGDQLMTDPGAEMTRAQRILRLPVKVTARNFVFVKERSFYCARSADDGNDAVNCLHQSKGSSRTVTADGVVVTKMSKKAESTLKTFFRYFITDFYDLTRFGDMWFDHWVLCATPPTFENWEVQRFRYWSARDLSSNGPQGIFPSKSYFLLVLQCGGQAAGLYSLASSLASSKWVASFSVIKPVCCLLTHFLRSDLAMTYFRETLGAINLREHFKPS